PGRVSGKTGRLGGRRGRVSEGDRIGFAPGQREPGPGNLTTSPRASRGGADRLREMPGTAAVPGGCSKGPGRRVAPAWPLPGGIRILPEALVAGCPVGGATGQRDLASHQPWRLRAVGAVLRAA